MKMDKNFVTKCFRSNSRTLSAVIGKYQPDACVVQCGADSIAGDPLGGANLLPEDFAFCIEKILTWNLPTMFLGGGKSFQSNRKLSIDLNSLEFISSMHFFVCTIFKVDTIFKMQHAIGLI